MIQEPSSILDEIYLKPKARLWSSALFSLPVGEIKKKFKKINTISVEPVKTFSTQVRDFRTAFT